MSAAMLALARIEGVRLLRHPVVVAGVLLFLGPLLYDLVTGSGNEFPILQDEDYGLQFMAMLLLGGGAMVAANLAALRAQRQHTAAMFDVLVLPQAWRAGAFLLAVVPLAGVAAVLVALRLGVAALAPGAAGRPNPLELVLSPVVVLLLGAAGVLLARANRSAILAPLALLSLLVVSFTTVMPELPGMKSLRWLLPVGLEPAPLRLPAYLISRPAGVHLLYVAGLTALAAVVTLLLAGARGRWLVAAAATGLSVAGVAGTLQLIPPDGAPRAAAVADPTARQECERVGQVTYCAFPDFLPWVGAWDEVVQGVLRRVPDERAAQPFAVRQRVAPERLWAREGDIGFAEIEADVAWAQANAAAGTPRAVWVGTTWGDGRAEVGFAGRVAYHAIGGIPVAGSGMLCGGRGVLVAWLAAQATPETAAGLRELDRMSWGAISFGDVWAGLYGVSVDDREMTVVKELLQRPPDETAQRMRASWATLSAPATTLEQVGELFGVEVPPAPAERDRPVCLP